MVAILEEFAAYLARGFGASTLVVVGDEAGPPELPALAGLGLCRLTPGRAASFPCLSGALLRAALVLLVTDADAPDRLAADLGVLTGLLREAPRAVLGVAGSASPAARRALGDRLAAGGLAPAFIGDAPPGALPRGEGLVAIIDRDEPPAHPPAPAWFRVVAFIRTFNEDDVIDHCIRALVEQGIEVYIVDGWSTDATIARAERWRGRGLIGIERFPPEGPSSYHTQVAVLRRIERLATAIPARWFILHDADERRMSPWTGLSLRDGLYHVDRRGFTCIDHTVIEFPPMGDLFDPEQDFAAQLTRYQFAPLQANPLHRKAWKNLGLPVSIADSGGHDATFAGRRIFPYQFLLRHYPFRTREQARRKLLRERRTRLVPAEAARGLGAHYLRVADDLPCLANPATLAVYDEANFNRRLLVERLSGIGRQRYAPMPTAPARAATLQVIPTRLAWTEATLEAALAAAPAPDPARPTPPVVVVRWDSRGIEPAEVHVAERSRPERLFAAAAAGEQAAPWIESHVPYRFRLYAGTRREALMAEIEVTYRT